MNTKNVITWFVPIILFIINICVTYIPVSYTHLAEAVSVGMCLDILYSVRKGWLPAAEAERIVSVLKALGPVSYTHLDVYKRQRQYRTALGQQVRRTR